MHKYQVGQPYSPGRTRWPERPDLSIGPEGVELRLFLANPAAGEIEAVRKGSAQFAWIEAEHTAILAYAFEGGVPWSDVMYQSHNEPQERSGMPGPYGTQLLAHILLIDALTGIIAAMRMVSWPAEAADAIRTTIQRQQSRPYNRAAEQAYIQHIYATYPSDVLVRDRADITWTGGETHATPGTGEAASPPAAAKSSTSDDEGPRGIVRGLLGNNVIAYPTPLPDDLAPWHTYLPDAGHSIVALLHAHRDEWQHGDEHQYLIPVPVKSIQKAGWTKHNGYIVVDLPYDPTLGLITPAEDDEF